MSKVILKAPNGNTVAVSATEAKWLIEHEGYRKLTVDDVKVRALKGAKQS